MIFLKPHSGLTNRMRVIVSGLSYSSIIKQPLQIVWEKDSGLNCDFEDLFEPVQNVKLISNYKKFQLLDKIKDRKLLGKIIYKLFKIDFSLFDSDFPKYVWSSNSDNINTKLLPANIRNYYIKTCHEFSVDDNFLKCLIPVQAVKNLINLEVTKFPKLITGIHIRRTDNAQSIKESPLELFIEKIKMDLLLNPDLSFFLATDDEDTEIKLKDLFPNKIITINKINNRNSKEGIISAMVDLYCLSATQKIYGSFYSSFSSMAARIGEIPIEIIQHK